MKTPSDNAGDLHRAIERLLQTQDGQHVIFWILECAGVYLDAFSAHDANTNYRLGRQSIGKQIINELNSIDPMLYPQLILRHADLAKQEKTTQTRTQETSSD